MRTDDIIAGLVRGIYWAAGAIFAGELTLMVIYATGVLR